MTKILFVDIETSDYEGSEITLVCLRDRETGITESFHGEHLRDLYSSKLFDPSYTVVGHNLICFDWPILVKHFPELTMHERDLYDTLVVSRLLHYRRAGGHSLAALGEGLGVQKLEPPMDMFVYTEELEIYCRQDVEVLAAIYEDQQKWAAKEEWKRAIPLELKWARLCFEIQQTGFYFRVEEARKLSAELKTIRDRLLSAITSAFPLRVVEGRTITPALTKAGNFHRKDFNWYDGDDYSIFTPDAPFTLITFERFNPGSTKQVIDALNSFGWQPTEKTKGHIEFLRSRKKDKEKLARFREYGWKISEVNLATLPDTAPAAAHDLAVYRVIDRRINMIDDQWLPAVKEDNRIHGTITPISTWTHRVAHSNPNVGNIVRPFGDQDNYTRVEAFKHEYDGRLRGLWAAAPGKRLVGVDIKSAHLRILAHLIDDPDYTKELLSGDPHTLTQNKLGAHICKSRSKAKIFIYTWLNGGKAAKQAQLFQCTPDQAQQAIDSFVTSMPGLDRLINYEIPRDAARGYFVGIDGRLVEYDAEHGMIAGYLQNAERILLSTAVLNTLPMIKSYGASVVNVVHDECQIEFSGGDHVGNMIGETVVSNLQQAGREYNLRCPIDGDYRIGWNWKESH